MRYETFLSLYLMCRKTPQIQTSDILLLTLFVSCFFNKTTGDEGEEEGREEEGEEEGGGGEREEEYEGEVMMECCWVRFLCLVY